MQPALQVGPGIEQLLARRDVEYDATAIGLVLVAERLEDQSTASVPLAR